MPDPNGTTWTRFLIARERATATVPFQGSERRVWMYYFKRADTSFAVGQWRPTDKIEICAILKGTTDNREYGREEGIFSETENVAAFVRTKGHLEQDIVENTADLYKFLKGLKFFIDVVPRPTWLDERVDGDEAVF
jgi:hypothetical protein